MAMQQPHISHESGDALAKDGIAGEIAFVSPEVQTQRTAELLGMRVLVVEVPPIAASMRGRLGEHVDDCVERALAAHGAPAAYLVSGESGIAEQLFRARSVGASGIAIAMGSIAAVARPALSPEDSATVRALARAAAEAPVVVMVDDGDASIWGYAEPVPMAALMGCAAPIVVRREPIATPLVTEEEETQDETEVALVESETVNETEVAAAPEEIEAEIPEPTVEPEPVEIEAERRRIAVRAGVAVSGPNDFWRGWAMNLVAAKGPQPLASFQRLFVESYMPLAHAIAQGVDDARALRAYDEFRRSFERAYADAFETFGATNRRPRLVMDAHDWASKQARLHNARIAQVLVIDSMRWDLGGLVRDALCTRTLGAASLAAETGFFAALPSTTIRQLETIARGIDALRAPAAQDPSESLRGRAAETIRRLRVGSREVFKLDLVPAMLAPLDTPIRGGSEQVVAAFDEIADAVADAIARHIDSLTTRTLLLVTGDHGFCLDRRGRITQGGAAPEEVLVPAFAYLVGEQH
jgi:hypothetical protein